jgi:hypothetical protein
MRTITTRPTPDAGEILEADPADRPDAGDLATYPRASTLLVPLTAADRRRS